LIANGENIARPALTVQAKGEDFDGFMTKLNASNLPDKQAIANVINSQIALQNVKEESKT
jgi:hypothetical protein